MKERKTEDRELKQIDTASSSADIALSPVPYPLSARVPILILICLAFWLRIYGFDFGLPYHFHPDEDQYVDVALRWYTEGHLEPRLINPPFFTYFLALAYGLWFVVSPFEPSTQWVTAAYIFARLWSAAFGLLTVALMYPLGKRLYNKKAGLIAAVLLAGLFLPAREAHFAVNDTAVTFFVLGAIYLSLNILRRNQQRSYIMAGGAVGLATATKFMGALVVLALLGAYLLTLVNQPLRPYKKWLRWTEHTNLWLSLLAALVTFLVITSFHIFWRFTQLFQIVTWHLAQGAESYKGSLMAPATGWQFYLGVFGWGMGGPMLAAVAVSLGVIFWARYRPGLVLVVFPIALFAYMGSQKILFARYLLPTFPPLVSLVAINLVWLDRQWPWFRRNQLLFWPLVVGMLLAQPLANLIWFDHLLTLPDTREMATQWFSQQIPPDSLVAMEPYSILPDTVFIDDSHWPYQTFLLNNQGSAPRNALNHYLTNKAEFIVLSNFTSGRVRQDPQEEQIRREQLAFWDKEAILLKTFNPYRQIDTSGWFYQDQIYGSAAETLQRLYPGPLIKIYRLPYEKQPYRLDKPNISIPVEANFGQKLMLLGYDLTNQRAHPGEVFPITLYWQALSRMAENYVSFNHLLDQQQKNWGGYDRLPQEVSKTTLWIPGEIVVDTFNLPIAPDAPDGIYTIDIGLYNQADSAAKPLPLVRDGQLLNQSSVRIGPVKIGGPPPAVLVSSKADPPNPTFVKMGEPPIISLRGYDLVQQNAALQLNLYWESLAQTPIAWTTFVHLTNQLGETIVQQDGPTGGGLYPTSLWDTGEIIADSVTLPRPPALKPGKYTLKVGLYQLESGQRLIIPTSTDNSITLTTINIAP